MFEKEKYKKTKPKAQQSQATYRVRNRKDYNKSLVNRGIFSV
jgi:hypothetical protein